MAEIAHQPVQFFAYLPLLLRVPTGEAYIHVRLLTGWLRVRIPSGSLKYDPVAQGKIASETELFQLIRSNKNKVISFAVARPNRRSFTYTSGYEPGGSGSNPDRSFLTYRPVAQGKSAM